MVYSQITDNGLKTQWLMCAAEDVIIPANERKKVFLGVTFDVPPNMLGTWSPDPYHRDWKPSMGSLCNFKFTTQNYQFAMTMTREINIHNTEGEIAYIQKGTTIALLQFDPIAKGECASQATVCSVSKGAKTYRERRTDPWSVYSTTSCIIPPKSECIIQIGVTYHVPPEKLGIWEICKSLDSMLKPVNQNYIKDPELVVHNFTDREVELHPDMAIANMRLIPKPMSAMIESNPFASL
jgi:hypothetical protein